jgi:hypothetical protein
MRPTTCPACGYEYDTPARYLAGNGCPRCGELIGPVGALAPDTGAMDLFLTALFGGAVLGALTAAILIFSRG